MGYNVFQAEDGATAIQTMKAQKPNLLLLDMRLPDMDGLEILAEAKKIFPSMPVVMLSGFGDVETAVGAIKRGAFDYLSKPFRVDDVRNVVQKALASAASGVAQVVAGVGSPSAPATAPAAKSTTASKPSKGKSFAMIGASALVLAAAAGAFLFKEKLLPAAADKQFSTPYNNPTALSFSDNQYLWVADWVKESVYRHKLDDTLSVDQIFNNPGSHPTGIAWDGRNLWTCNSWEHKIYRHAVDSKLTVVGTYDSPGSEPSGLFWDGVNLWVCDVKAAKFYQMKVNDDGLSVVNEYASPGSKPVAFFATAENYWSADTDKKYIYKHAKDAALTVQKIYSIPDYDARNLFISGMAWDGKSIWTCADEYPKVTRHNLKNLKEVKF